MSEQPQKPLSLDLASSAIFMVPGTQPVAILNEASSPISKLQYCEGVVANLKMISSICTAHDHIDVQYLADVFSNQLEPLSKMLEHLVAGAETLGRA